MELHALFNNEQSLCLELNVIKNFEKIMKKAHAKFYPQTALESLGAKYQSNTKAWSPNVVVDRELITGQNPASAVLVGKSLLEKLK